MFFFETGKKDQEDWIPGIGVKNYNKSQPKYYFCNHYHKFNVDKEKNNIHQIFHFTEIVIIFDSSLVENPSKIPWTDPVF